MYRCPARGSRRGRTSRSCLAGSTCGSVWRSLHAIFLVRSFHPHFQNIAAVQSRSKRIGDAGPFDEIAPAVDFGRQESLQLGGRGTLHRNGAELERFLAAEIDRWGDLIK